VTFFFDNCISDKISRAIRTASSTKTIHLREKLPDNSGDVVWIEYVARHKYVAVSGDLNTLANELEKEAVLSADTTFYYVYRDFPSQGRWEQFKWMIWVWDRIVAHQSTADRCAYQVRRNGHIHKVTCYDDFE
jgi:hypothetical protein